MLTPADDTPWHQVPVSFECVGTSDPRFFDRYWFGAYDRNGRGALQVGLGVYNNMNVVDGGIMVIRDGKQHNLRVSRTLRPRFDTSCGPLKVRVLEPLKSFEVAIDDGDHDVSGTFRWDAEYPPDEEAPHFQRVRGRVTEDSQRFNQIGRATGQLVVDGEPLDLDGWWGARDRSWGIRPRTGIREPVTGPPRRLENEGFVMNLLFFSTEELGGHIHYAERGERREYTTGVFRERASGAVHTIVDVRMEVSFFKGSERFRWARLICETAEGQFLTVESEPVCPAFAMRGLGYSGGFNDGRGLGAWRGEEITEHDTWDVSDPAEIMYPDGSRDQHWHRIQPVRLAGGLGKSRTAGLGSMTLLASGRLPRLAQMTVADPPAVVVAG